MLLLLFDVENVDKLSLTFESVRYGICRAASVVRQICNNGIRFVNEATVAVMHAGRCVRIVKIFNLVRALDYHIVYTAIKVVPSLCLVFAGKDQLELDMGELRLQLKHT